MDPNKPPQPDSNGMQSMLQDMIKKKMKETFEKKYMSSLDNIKRQ